MSPKRKPAPEPESDDGSPLAALRRKRGLAFYTVASMAGISPPVVRRAERGEPVLADNLVAIATALEVEPAQVFALWLAAASARIEREAE